VLSNCVIIKNSATFQNTNSGGGVYSSILSDCRLVANACFGGGGGAYASDLTRCSISNNAAIQGGGVFASVVTQSLVSSNRASISGGGAYDSVVFNCVLQKNLAVEQGGGAYQSTAVNCTVVNNTASTGGGGLLGGTATNCIVYYNSGGNFQATDPMSYCCSWPLPASGVWNITNEPSFLNLAAGNWRLQTNSPCINSGLNSATPTDLDLDQLPRIAGGTVDMGAYEFQSPLSVISYAWLQQFGLPTDGSADGLDSDEDTRNTWQEWRCGTDPTDPLSVLRVSALEPNAFGIFVTWPGVSGVRYFLERSDDLGVPGFSLVQDEIPGGTGTMNYLDSEATGVGPFFYRVGVR
jgi:hypothetical protein